MSSSDNVIRDVERIEAARDDGRPGGDPRGGIYEEIPFGVWMARPDGGLRYASRNFLQLLGMSIEEAQGFGWTARVLPEDGGSVERWKAAVAQERDWDDEHRIADRDGQVRTLLARGHPLRDEAGQVACWIGVHLDITERKRAEQLVREARDFAQALVATVPDPLLVLDGRQRVLAANPAFYRVFRTAPGATEGTPLRELGSGQWDIPELRRLVETVLDADASVGDYEVEHDFPDIGRKVMLVNGRRVLRHGGREELVLLVLRDVTAHKTMEDELRVVRESEAVQGERQRLAQRLHDDMQQLLLAAKMRVELVLQDPRHADNPRLLEQAQGLLGESVAAARNLAVELAPPVLFEGGFRAAAEWLAVWMRDKHGLEVGLEVGPDVCEAESGICLLLFEAARELLLNVVKHAGVRRAWLRVERADGGRVQVVVTDEGGGFDAQQTLEARPAAGATSGGFGLATLRRRIRSVGGTFDLRSGKGGTTATVRAPLRRFG